MGDMSIPQAARLWERNPDTLRDFCRRGLIPGAYKNGRGWWRIPEGDEPPGLRRNAKLTEVERREVARLGHAKANKTELAKRYGVKRLHVYHLMEKYPPEEGG